LLYLFDAIRSFSVAQTPPFDILDWTAVSPLKRTKKKMPLHRDIFWVGKQWAVTGYGMQACDQKQKGKFDIEAARLWEDGLSESMQAHKWLNTGDFDKALSIAREHYPEPPRKEPRRKAAPATPAVAAPAAPALAVPAAPAVAAPPPRRELKKAKDQPKEIPQPVPAIFAMRLEGCRARFLPTWRVRSRR
jgi:hypothetical protein